MRRGIPLLAGVLFLAAYPALAQDRALRPLSSEQLEAVMAFFECDQDAPLDAHVVATDEALGFRREKVTFVGSHGRRVTGYLSVPSTSGPAPLVLLQHGGAFSKEAWWSEGAPHHGAALVAGLLKQGVAVAALDAPGHGERTNEVDYVPIRTLWFDQQRWVVFRDIWMRTTLDYRRFIQYLQDREELDLRTIGTVGVSMGGVTSLYLAAAEPRVRVVVAGLSAVAEPWTYPISPINLSPALRGAKVLLLAGIRDPLAPLSNTEALAAALTPESRQLVTWDLGHELPAEYVERAKEWLVSGLVR